MNKIAPEHEALLDRMASCRKHGAHVQWARDCHQLTDLLGDPADAIHEAFVDIEETLRAAAVRAKVRSDQPVTDVGTAQPDPTDAGPTDETT